jgi:hypothetical protein
MLELGFKNEDEEDGLCRPESNESTVGSEGGVLGVSGLTGANANARCDDSDSETELRTTVIGSPRFCSWGNVKRSAPSASISMKSVESCTIIMVGEGEGCSGGRWWHELPFYVRSNANRYKKHRKGDEPILIGRFGIRFPNLAM